MSIDSSLSVSLKVGTFSKTNKVIVNVDNPKIQSTDSLVVVVKKRSKRWKVLEGVSITAVVLIIIVLTALPVVFFYLPRVSSL